MLGRLGSRLTYANVTATLALFLALGGGAYALSGSGSGAVLHGCVSNATGVLRVVANGRGCHKRTHKRGSGETAISWNQQGVPGAHGAAGAQGPQGPAGRDGQSAAALWAVVASDNKTVLSASDPSIIAEPSGVGAYVDFHQDIEGCAIEATDGSNGPAEQGTVQAAVRDSAHPTQARVDFREVGEGFHSANLDVAVFC